MSRGDLAETQWRILKDLLPVEREAGKRGRGRPPEDNRDIINGILWRRRTGTPWRDVPEKYGNWNSIYRRFRRWSASSVWESAATSRRTKRRIADQLTRQDFLILDELGYLPFAQSGGQLLLHLVSRLYERTSIIVTTKLAFSDAQAPNRDRWWLKS